MKKISLLLITAVLLVSCGSKSFEERTSHYDQVGDIVNGAAWVVKDNRIGFVDSTGKEIAPCKYYEAYPFTEGLAAVKFVNNWGFIDMKGKEVIPTIYSEANPFLPTGLAVVKSGNKYGMIDKKGDFVLEQSFSHISRFNEEGVASIAFGGSRQTNGGLRGAKWGIANMQGEIILPCKYNYIGSFNNDRAVVQLSEWGKYGYLNSKGEVAIPVEYDSAKDFEGDVARVSRSLGYGLIDKNGNQIAPFKYWAIDEFSNGLAPVRIQMMESPYRPTAGFINKNGEEFIRYEGVKPFSEGYAAVKIREEYTGSYYNAKTYWEYIDTSGNQITNDEFYGADNFKEGMARVYKNLEGYGFINTNGELVIPCKYDEAENFSNGTAKLKLYGKTYILDKNGQEI